ncbi:MAG: YjbF family lipoprotein [Burkholderiales bacterium]|nr:YjbF family lipoprotein [Burkholderiales bacterium]
MNAVVQTVQYAVKGQGVDSASLNPNFRYLRVTIEGRVALLALGNEDSHPQGPIEVWYSAQREVLRLQNGRLVGAVGLTTEWRNVVLPELPSWSAVAQAREPVPWVRVRDIMPGYRFGVRDTLLLRMVQPPQSSALKGPDPQSLSWFEERLQSDVPSRFPATLFPGLSADRPLPPARYAVALQEGRETVVYGEQCLAPDLCFSWQKIQ